MNVYHWIAAVVALSFIEYAISLRPTEKQVRAIVADEMCKTLVASKLAQSCTPGTQ